MDEAYRRIHANASTAVTCISIVDELDFLCLRLPFRTKASPTEYKTVNEAAINSPESRITRDNGEDFS